MKYESPEFQIIYFEYKDIVALSSEPTGTGEGIDGYEMGFGS